MEEKKARNAAKDLFCGVLLVLFGIYVIIDSLNMKVYNTFIDAPGFFPTIIGGVLVVLGAVLAFIGFKLGGAKELAEVYRSMAKKAKYKLSADTENWLLPYISMLTEKRDKNFGNARWARNLFEKSVERQSLRVTELADPSAEELVTIRLRDLGVKLKDPDASDED
jgi:hypothetical protein